jgi:hypothetical protein
MQSSHMLNSLRSTYGVKGTNTNMKVEVVKQVTRHILPVTAH